MLDDFIGRIIEETYQIEEPLGAGGMGFVFKALDRSLERPVALKVTKPELALSLGSVDSFIEEARIVAKLQYPFIVSVYNLGRLVLNGQNLAYLAMQYAAGGALINRLEAGSISPEKAEKILRQVGSALDYAHKQKIIHLDLKPHNILFDEKDNVLVADFGLAKLLHTMSRVKGKTGAGTPAYMPPEQFMGKDVGPFSDVYALGITLHQMLTRETPERKWRDDGLYVHLDQNLPPGIYSVIEKATQHKPEQRYQTAGALTRDYARALHAPDFRAEPTQRSLDHPTPVFPPLETSQSSASSPRDKKPRRWLLPLVGAGLITVAALLVVILLGSNGSTPESTGVSTPAPAQAQVPFASATASRTATSTVTPITPTETPSPAPSPSATATASATPSPTAYAKVISDQSPVRAGPGEQYQELGEVHRGYQMALWGRSPDQAWWQVDYLSWAGWIPAHAAESSSDLSNLPVLSAPPPPSTTPTETPKPTVTATSQPTLLNGVVFVQNAGFNGIQDTRIPGWSWWAYDNFEGEFTPEASYNTPLIKQADDPARFISGPTLQIDASAYLKFRVHVFQKVPVSPNTQVRFLASAGAYTDGPGILVAAGIDSNGGPGCDQAQWGEILELHQSDEDVELTSPKIAVGQAGQVTICLYAETPYSVIKNAAFFDDARLIAVSE